MRKLALILSLALVGCSGATVTITDGLISTDYIGNGVEWDPYDEALSYGCPLSELDWEKLYERLDYMQPQYVRCMINSPYTYFTPEGSFDLGRNDESLRKLLEYCQSRNVTVVYGEYNPPTWEMKASERWVEASVSYLNKWVVSEGFDCIKYFVIFNEPDGNWASTNGDYELWKSMALRFSEKMAEYPLLSDKVSLAGPDVVLGYKNSASSYDAEGWVEASGKGLDDIVGVYDIHSYPGQAQVRSGEYAEQLRSIRSKVPKGKKIILGESGYKYDKPGDEALYEEYWRRVADCPFTKGSDCNMLVYDYFYGVDMALLAVEAMNEGFSGLAAWMLDDAMHSSGDSGKTEDMKIWGMWNILGEELFKDASQEEVRPWYYAWSILCRAFPKGCDILRVEVSEGPIKACAARYGDEYSLVLVNISDEPQTLRLNVPFDISKATVYEYCSDNYQGCEKAGKNITLKPLSVKLITRGDCREGPQ